MASFRDVADMGDVDDMVAWHFLIGEPDDVANFMGTALPTALALWGAKGYVRGIASVGKAIDPCLITFREWRRGCCAPRAPVQL